MNASLAIYPESRADRDTWIIERRGERNILDASQPYAFFVEEECSKSGELVPVATIFLTNRECPWRCLMCDLWKNTLTETVQAGAIPRQIGFALERLPMARQVKLYNSGSFFDPHAIPLDDYPRIADRVAPFERVIVESHPGLVANNCFRFKDLLNGQLEVAMGLETVHPQTLDRLNKGMTLEQFAAAAGRLRQHHIDLRVFILVKPPFLSEDEALTWAERSLDFAFDCGASAVSLIPTRGGNGAMEELTATGDFEPPGLKTLEAATAYGLSLGRGRVFADLWEVAATQPLNACNRRRIERLQAMNRSQIPIAEVTGDVCGAGY